ncbi:MAG TPA: hypothetical protein VFO34_03740 [Candidatus Acidoferrales bacterium]|nr:hypothetical protein [Candidatus Acidoferrales bacterium]
MLTSAKLLIGSVALAATLAIGTSAFAQQTNQTQSQQNQSQQGQTQQGQTQQKPLDTRVNPPANSSSDTSDSGQVTPDTHSLSGAETYGVGGIGHSYFLPSLQFAEYADTNDSFAGSSANLEPVTQVGGQLLYKKIRSRQDFTVQYSGGGVFYDRGSASNYTYQQMGISEKYSWRRASIQLSDYFSYLPDSGYGAGGFGTSFAGGPPGLFGIGGIPFGLNPGFLSDQSIFTAFARRYDNSSFGEFDYQLSPRSSVTATGGYDMLHFFDSSLFNSHTYIFRGGYNYQATAKSTISFIYTGTLFRYNQFSADNFQVHIGQAAYGRRITGRLGLQLAAGPQVIVPLTGKNIYSWTVNSSLRYAWQRADVAVEYNRFTNNGGGIYFGAYANEFRLAGDRRVSRAWTVNANIAYARNTPIPLGVIANGTLNSYDSIYAGVSASRPVGRYISAFANYNFQWQSQGFCSIGFVCGPSFTRHVFGVGFNWNFRPIGSPEDLFHAISAGKAR